MTFLCGVLSTSNAKNEAINPDILCYALRFLIDIFLSLTPVCFFYSSILFCPLLPFLSLPDPHPGSVPSQVPPSPFPIPPSPLLSLLSCFTGLICSMSFTLAFVSLFLPIFLLHFSKIFLLFVASFTLPYSCLPPASCGLCHLHTLAVSHTDALPHFIAHTHWHFPHTSLLPPRSRSLLLRLSHTLALALFFLCFPSPALLCLCYSLLLSSSLCLFFSTLSPSPSLSFLFLGSDVIL